MKNFVSAFVWYRRMSFGFELADDKMSEREMKNKKT